MKKKLILFTVIVLLLGLVGCEKESSELEFIKQKLIGSWEWVASYGGIVGIKKPLPDEKLFITFTDERVIIAHNNEIIQDGNYIITKKNSNFYITITSEMTPKSLIYASGSTELTLNETFDTLSFGVSIGSANLLSVYKRIKM